MKSNLPDLSINVHDSMTVDSVLVTDDSKEMSKEEEDELVNAGNTRTQELLNDSKKI